MNRWSRRVVIGVLVSGIAVSLGNAVESMSSDLGVDLWNLPSLHRSIRVGRILMEDLDAEFVVTGRRIAAKDAVVEALIGGRIDMAEAVARFRYIGLGQPRYFELLRLQYPAETDEQTLRLCILQAARDRVPDPAHRAKVMARLEAESIGELAPDR